jgi:DNA-binding beta-propeller fold protein YncE
LGRAEGQFHRPLGIAVNRDIVYIADHDNDRVQVFDKQGRFLRTIGSGEKEANLKGPTDIALDPEGALYVADTNNNRIVKYDREGRFLRQWGEWGPFPGFFDEPVALVWHGDRLLVVDRRNHRVQAFDGDGTFLALWGVHENLPHEGGGKLHYPNALAVAPGDKFGLVCEEIENRVQRFEAHPAGMADADNAPPVKSRTHFGRYLTIDGPLLAIAEPEKHDVFIFDHRREVPIIINKFGERGSGFGLMIRTSGIALDFAARRLFTSDLLLDRIQSFAIDFDPAATPRYLPEMTRFVASVDVKILSARIEPKPQWTVRPDALTLGPKGRIHILDSRNGAVYVFGPEYRFERAIGEYGNQPGQFRAPTDLAVDDKGRVYVVDSRNRRVQVFSRNGRYRFAFGAEHLRLPFGIALDSQGRVFVSDRIGDRILRFDRKGRFETAWGERGSDYGQLWDPAGLAVDDQDRLFVIDYGNHRAQVYTPDGEWLLTFGSGRAYTRSRMERQKALQQKGTP